MIYSKQCAYAIRALTYLARHPNERCRAQEISQEDGIPYYFLSQTLQGLVRDGLLHSTKGPGGGFQLARPAKAITLYEIKQAVDGVADLEECAVGLERCTERVPCPLHSTFEPLRERMRRYLQETNLAMMAQTVEEKQRRAAN